MTQPRIMLKTYDYCSSVWAPYKKGDIEALEKVQKKTTKILPALKNCLTVKD